MNGRSEPYFFAFETKTKPGKIIAHFVTFDSVELDADKFDETQFSLLGKDYDRDQRIRTMVSCVKGSSY